MSIALGAVALFLIGVLLNAFFAGYETGFVSADRIRTSHQAEEEGNRQAAILLKHMIEPERMITTVLIGTNGGLILGTMALSSLIPHQWLVILIATPTFLVFAEIIPKTVFRRHPNRLALALLPLIRFFDWILAPLVIPAMWASRALRWAARVKVAPSRTILATEEDFRSLVDESAARGTIEKDEQEMIHSVMDLADIQAKEVMVPRIDVQAVPITATRQELIELFERTGRTRIPVFKESIDDIVGVTIAYDLLLDTEPDTPDIGRFVREILHVPDTKPLDELLRELRTAHQHIAVVTDEYGGTDGIITLEDVLEEIFGEIQDEHDAEQTLIQRVGPGAYVADARMPLQDFAEVIGVDLGEHDAETVGGWVMEIAQGIPLQGEKIRSGGVRITVLEGEAHQILKVRVDVPTAPRDIGDEKR